MHPHIPKISFSQKSSKKTQSPLTAHQAQYDHFMFFFSIRKARLFPSEPRGQSLARNTMAIPARHHILHDLDAFAQRTIMVLLYKFFPDISTHIFCLFLFIPAYAAVGFFNPHGSCQMCMQTRSLGLLLTEIKQITLCIKPGTHCFTFIQRNCRTFIHILYKVQLFIYIEST